MNQEIDMLHTVSEHRIDFFFALDSHKIPVKSLEADLLTIRHNCPLPHRIRESLPEGSNGGQLKAWRKTSQPVHRDLNEAVRFCFDPSKPQGIGHFELSKEALKLLNGRPFKVARNEKNRGPATLEMAMKPEAKERLKRAGMDSTPALSISTINLYQFPTGISIIVASLAFTARPLLNHLQELLHGLSEHARLQWKDCHDKENDTTTPSFKLTELLQPLLGVSRQRWGRAFTATTVVIDGSIKSADIRQNLRKLARHYHLDYRLGQKKGSDIVLDEFDNRMEVTALEGLALAVFTKEGKPEYLAKFPNDGYRKAYFPLTLLAYHQHQALKQFTKQIAGWESSTSSFEDKRTALSSIQLNISNFRNNYLTPLVSVISMHNQHYQALRDVLMIDDLTRYLNEQTSDLLSRQESWLQEKAEEHQQKHEERVCRWGAIGVGAATLVTVHTIAHETLTSLYESFHLLEQYEKHFGLCSVILATGTGLLAWAIQRWNCRGHSTHHHHGPTHSLIEEHINHKMLHGSRHRGH